MGLANFTYRLKALAGDTTPHDEKAISGDLTGGTITLVDDGTGGKAWQFAGAATTTIPSMTENPTAAGQGKTIAVRMAVTTYPGGSGVYTALAACGPVELSQNSTANNLRVRRFVSSGAETLPIGTINTVYRTYVFKVVTAASGTLDVIKAWLDTVGRGGTSSNFTSSGGNFNSQTYSSLSLGTATAVIQVSDLVIWDEELSDADCVALADTGINATLDGSAAITGDLTITESTVDSLLSYSGANPNITGVLALAESGVDILASSGSITTPTGTITTPGIKDWNTGVLRTSETGITAFINNAVTGALVVSKTGLTSDAVTGTVTITDALIIPGTTYRVTIVLSDTSEGTWRFTAV